MALLSGKETLITAISTIAILAGYNAFAGANLFRSHIPHALRARALVQVLDLPDTLAFQQASGLYTNLGYKFDMLSGGEWVGLLTQAGQQWRTRKYVNHYMTYDESDLTELQRAVKLTNLPRVPPRPWPTLFVDFVVLWLALGFLTYLLKVISGGLSDGR
jgi:hypothetical protein